MQSFSASGTNGIVLIPENLVTKLEAVEEKWGNLSETYYDAMFGQNTFYYNWILL